ncbi:hypothetical protein [Flavobacterium davisii]|uniref:Uncharacterized protein n=1 Tax=Flavobacterium columnare TaxID=996 RepID=A0A8G0KY90_9FLAO|nr:hypothetical protein [Flavobacterium davisii]QYS89465.1 hypothetical protein JJC05_04080 [Flavobacterium davisii]
MLEYRFVKWQLPKTEALDLIKSSNNIKPEVNIAKAEVNLKNGQSYTSHATSGYPDPKSGNILTNPPALQIQQEVILFLSNILQIGKEEVE